MSNETEKTVEQASSRLRELFAYNPETGVFTWRIHSSSRVDIGDIAGCVNDQGYRIVVFMGKKTRAHRMAWLYVYGVWPTQEIDHMNGIRDDNRILNLRHVDRSTNMQNRRHAKANSPTGVLGVRKVGNRFRTSIGIGEKKYKYLGYFNTVEQAYQAYIYAKRDLHSGCTI